MDENLAPQIASSEYMVSVSEGILVDTEIFTVRVSTNNTICPFGYERVYLPLCKVADTPFNIQRDELINTTLQIIITFIILKWAVNP